MGVGHADERARRRHHRRHQRFGELDHRAHRRRIGAQATGDDQGIDRAAQELGRAFDRRRARLQRFGLGFAIGMNRDRVHLLRQHLARQRQIDRTLRRAERHFQGAVDDGLHLIAVAQLIVPTGELAQQAALIERLLAPVNEVAPAAAQPFFGERRSAGGEQHRHIEPRRIHHRRRGIAGADDDVHHHHLRLAGDHRIALRHADRDKLMRHGNRHRMDLLLRAKPCQRVNDRPKVRAAVAEKIFDPARAQDFKIGLADGLDLNGYGLVVFHGYLLLDLIRPIFYPNLPGKGKRF